LTFANCTVLEPVFVTLNQGSDWSAVAPVALVRYCTLSPSPAALAVDGMAVSAAAPMATATAADAAARSLPFANLVSNVVLNLLPSLMSCLSRRVG
jgi:hypothetical protein